MASVSIRRATPEDAEAILFIYVQSAEIKESCAGRISFVFASVTTEKPSARAEESCRSVPMWVCFNAEKGRVLGKKDYP